MPEAVMSTPFTMYEHDAFGKLQVLGLRSKAQEFHWQICAY